MPNSLSLFILVVRLHVDGQQPQQANAILGDGQCAGLLLMLDLLQRQTGSNLQPGPPIIFSFLSSPQHQPTHQSTAL